MASPAMFGRQATRGIGCTGLWSRTAPGVGRGCLCWPQIGVRGMKYNLFPPLDFLAYLKRIHVAYHPGRERTEVARKLIMHMTSERTKKRWPKLEASFELLGLVLRVA
eukprot:s3642_g4.t1